MLICILLALYGNLTFNFLTQFFSHCDLKYSNISIQLSDFRCCIDNYNKKILTAPSGGQKYNCHAESDYILQMFSLNLLNGIL